MKLRIEKQWHRIYTEAGFKAIIVELWEGMGPEVFGKYAGTMPKWLALLKKAKGGVIKY